MRMNVFAAAFGAVSMTAAVAFAQTCPQSAPHYRGEWALALTWQAAFCQTVDTSKRPSPKECPTASRMTTMTLHGLWPQWADYCDKSAPCDMKDRSKMPMPALSPDVRRRLERVMPGIASDLDRYEYFKHGSCAEMPADAYFEKAIKLVDKLNASSFPQFLADNAGRTVTKRRVCEAVGKALGAEAVPAVEADAKRVVAPDGQVRFYFTELRIGLKADKGGDLDLSPAHYLPVRAGAKTLGPKPADPLCDDNLDNHRFYIDIPGMDR